MAAAVDLETRETPVVALAAPAVLPAVLLLPSARNRPLVQVVKASRRYGRIQALSEISLSLGAGQTLFLTGPSGVGKTTLLRLLHGQVRPSKGEVWVGGQPFHRRWWRGVEGARRHIGFVFQDSRLLPRLTALENVIFALQLVDPQVPYRRVRRRAQEVLESVELGDRLHSYPEHLSGGERQRVAVARALAGRPALLLADEPTSALDDRRAVSVLRLLRAAAEEGAAVVVAVTSPTGFERGNRVVQLRPAPTATKAAGDSGRKPALKRSGPRS